MFSAVRVACRGLAARASAPLPACAAGALRATALPAASFAAFSSAAGPARPAERAMFRVDAAEAVREEEAATLGRALSMANASARDRRKERTRQAIGVFQKRDGDVGSTPSQIAALSVRIEALRTHMAAHHKDKHTRYGLVKLVAHRRRLLQYLRKRDFEAYRSCVLGLGLPGFV